MSSRSSKTEGPQPLPDTVVVARIRRPHGLRGELAVSPLSDVPGRLEAGSELLLVGEGGRRERVRLVSARGGRRGTVVRIEGYETREQAEELRGAVLEIERSKVPPAPSGSFYHYELEGCTCRERSHGELGVVVAILEDGGGTLLRVEGDQRVLLVPFVESFLRRVDPEERIIELELPPGLIEACGSTS